MSLFVEVELDALFVEVSGAPVPGPPGPLGPPGDLDPANDRGLVLGSGWDAPYDPVWTRTIFAGADADHGAQVYVANENQAGLQVDVGPGKRAAVTAYGDVDADQAVLDLRAERFTLNGSPWTPDATAAIAAHEADTTNVHGIPDTAALATTSGVTAAVAAHEADTTNVHGIPDTAALATTSGVTAAVAAHEADTTNVHGIPDTAALATTSGVTAAVAAHEADTTNVHGIPDTAALATAASVAAVGVWQSYTPTVSGFTLGNGTVNGRYTQIGKTVHVRVSITLGSSSVVADLGVSMPVAAASALTYQTIGYSTALQTGVAFCSGTVYGIGTGTAQFGLFLPSTPGQISGITPTLPFTWAANDVVHMRWTYEAA